MPGLHDWHDFFVAEVGASAALAGLVAVAISINLKQILTVPHLPGRGAETLILLVAAMIVASFALVPGQPIWLLGGEITAVGVTTATIAIWLSARAFGGTARHHRRQRVYQRVALSQLAGLPVAIGGIVLVFGSFGGLYWVMAGILMSLLVGMMNAWVLLVEILR